MAFSFYISDIGDVILCRELHRLGTGAKLARRRSVTPASLDRRIEGVLAAPGMAARAGTIALAMKKKNGVAEAARLIGEQFGRGNAPSASARAYQAGQSAAV